ncbi:uncharacterized protein BDV14DRAFT_194723 [Aspergillus stella-maris]|uniref:uncharacterized protein n=1 Tax=Aspergillus stella-maris TaxID=1810926 RepID=UPI003CCE1B95
MSGVGEASGVITLGGAIIKLAHFVEVLKQSSGQLERYVVVLRSIDRTTDLIDSLAAASRENYQLQSLSVFFNGDKHSLISSCKTNTKAILADAKNLIEICKRAESKGAQDTIRERLRRFFKNSVKTARWVFNESHMKELINAATQLESSLFMAYSSLMLAGNEIRQSDTQSTLKALTDTVTRQIQNFVESQKEYQRDDIDVLRSVVPVEQPEPEVKRPSSLFERGRQALSLRGGSQAGRSTTSLRADESIKSTNSQSNFVSSEPGKQHLQTIAVIRNDGRMDSSLGNSAQGELATGLFEKGTGETPIETPLSHTNSLEQLGAAGAVAGIFSLARVKASTERTEGVVGTETQVPSTPCDSARTRQPWRITNNSLFSTHPPPMATNDKSNLTADAQTTLSVNGTIDTIASTLAAGMVKFCVKTMTVHHDGSLFLILREPCRAEINDCGHISLISQFDIDYQKPSGIYSVSILRGPARSILFPAPATIARSVLYGCRSGDTHTIILESYGTQKQSISPQFSAQTVLAVLAQWEGIPEGEGRETQTAPTGDMAPVYDANQGDGIEPVNCLPREDNQSGKRDNEDRVGIHTAAVALSAGSFTLCQD